MPATTERLRDTSCCPGLVPSLDEDATTALAQVAKALGDPTRLRIVDVVRAADDAVCQCELLPLFAMSQPALSKHLKVLVHAGILHAERRGTWTYYTPAHAGLEELTSWLT